METTNPTHAPTPETPAQSAAQTTCVSGIGAGTVSVPGKSGLTIGDNACERLSKLAGEKGSESGLRVAVKGGGCAGFSYSLAYEDKPTAKDRVFARGNARLFVDPKSYIYLIGSVVEWEQKLMQAAFKVTNPQAKSSCGCGDSFGV